MDEKARFLKSTFFFSHFNEEELKEISKLIGERVFKKETVIFHENDPGSTFYLIKSGRIKVFKMSKDGRELILGIFGEGGIFGDVPVFDGGPYPATATTLTDAKVYTINRRDFENLVTKHPEISLKIIRVLGRRLRQAHNLIRDLAFKNVPQRLASSLLKLAADYGRDTTEGVYLELPLSRQDLAELMGVSRETAIRELSKFAKAGLIKVEGRKITILDKEKLVLWS